MNNRVRITLAGLLSAVFLLGGCGEQGAMDAPAPVRTVESALSAQEAIGIVQAHLREVDCRLVTGHRVRWEAKRNGGEWVVRRSYWYMKLVRNEQSGVWKSVETGPINDEWVLSLGSRIVTAQQKC